MPDSDITIQQRTEDFSIRVIKAYTELNKRNFDDAGKLLSKQFLRSGTSIGANCAEAVYAQMREEIARIIKILTSTINKLKQS